MKIDPAAGALMLTAGGWGWTVKAAVDWAMAVLMPSLAMTRISPWVDAAKNELSIARLCPGKSNANGFQLVPSSALYSTV
jgi:hypothetical protein